MFECNIDFIKNILQEELGEHAEFFHDIHCSDPFDNKLEYVFPMVAVHTTGLYLVFLAKDSKGRSEDIADKLDYICRVFKSYFFTKIPIRSMFLQEGAGKKNVCERLAIYDTKKRELYFDCLRSTDGLYAYIDEHIRTDGELPEEESNELISRLSKEGAHVLERSVGDSEHPNIFVKRASKWHPAFNKDSDVAFYLAAAGGFLGIHRFYLGLYGSGILYLFTFGLFGVGWLCDCIEILLGSWNHKGVYLTPVRNKARKATVFFATLGAMCLGVYLSIANLG